MSTEINPPITWLNEKLCNVQYFIRQLEVFFFYQKFFIVT